MNTISGSTSILSNYQSFSTTAKSGNSNVQNKQNENDSLFNSLDELVSSGTITTEQEDAIKQSIMASMQGGQAMQGPPPGMPPEMTDSLDGLVSSGTLTEDQEDTIMSAIDSAMQSSNGSMSIEDIIAGVLDDLVSSGTLTDDEEDTVQSALSSSQKDDYSVETQDMLSGYMLQQARDSYNSTSGIADPLESLVSSGTITQDQEDIIKSMLSASYGGSLYSVTT
jgi:polyhydroxyalkanoate synthesis regulator phasin